MTGIRIGAVSYLNTRPLVYGLQDNSEYSLTLDLPSALAERLRLEEIDVGLIPIVEYLRGIGNALLPGICIASDGPVRTVKLFSRIHPEKLTSVAVDAGSRTSVALLRILLSERFGVTPSKKGIRGNTHALRDFFVAARSMFGARYPARIESRRSSSSFISSATFTSRRYRYALLGSCPWPRRAWPSARPAGRRRRR